MTSRKRAPRPAPEVPFRTGFVALVGRPNVGKSTLINRYVGQKIAAVSARPQTTRHAIRGVVTRPSAQLVFVDTPGIHKPLHLLGQLLVEHARSAMEGVDAVVFMVDANEAPGPGDRFVADMLRAAAKPAILALNKIDRRKFRIEYQQGYEALGDWLAVVGISAQRGNNCERLLRDLEPLLPIGPPLFPEDQITDQTLRQLAGELVREQVLRQTEEEVPHAVAVFVEDWKERGDGLTEINATLFVERESQKRILIGEGGSRLMEIGTRARVEIEKLLGGRAHLALWVKVLPNWRRQRAALRKLGYVVE